MEVEVLNCWVTAFVMSVSLAADRLAKLRAAETEAAAEAESVKDIDEAITGLKTDSRHLKRRPRPGLQALQPAGRLCYGRSPRLA